MDATKGLQTLRTEWSVCTACHLGRRRQEVEGNFLFGGGQRRGILFVGEGPGEPEEESGKIFSGITSEPLHGLLKRFQIGTYYLTYLVSCRSCAIVENTDGTPMLSKSYGGRPGKIRYKDETPLPVSIEACRARLLEEIYLVDPVVIVTLGPAAAKALTDTNITLQTERGRERTITVPGATQRAVLTDKKGAWVRKAGGKLVAPTEPNEVRYLCIPTLSLGQVSKRIADRGPDSVFMQFAKDIKLAAQIYEKYLLEAYNITPTGATEATSEDIYSDINHLAGGDDE